jgi:hypothetical protein
VSEMSKMKGRWQKHGQKRRQNKGRHTESGIGFICSEGI